jgi:hypothetical protein
VLLAPQVRAAPAQQAFSDWQVTCNNQNFCVARNTGEHRGLVMTLSRSAGAKTDATLRIDLGGLDDPSVKSLISRRDCCWITFRLSFRLSTGS